MSTITAFIREIRLAFAAVLLTRGAVLSAGRALALR